MIYFGVRDRNYLISAEYSVIHEVQMIIEILLE